MGIGLFIGSLVVLIIGLLIGGFGWFAGTTSNDEYKRLNCNENMFTENQTLSSLCNYEGSGMWVGIGAFILAAIFIIVGVIASIITGIKWAIDLRKSKKITT